MAAINLNLRSIRKYWNKWLQFTHSFHPSFNISYIFRPFYKLLFQIKLVVKTWKSISIPINCMRYMHCELYFNLTLEIFNIYWHFKNVHENDIYFDLYPHTHTHTQIFRLDGKSWKIDNEENQDCIEVYFIDSFLSSFLSAPLSPRSVASSVQIVPFMAIQFDWIRCWSQLKWHVVYINIRLQFSAPPFFYPCQAIASRSLTRLHNIEISCAICYHCTILIMPMACRSYCCCAAAVAACRDKHWAIN